MKFRRLKDPYINIWEWTFIVFLIAIFADSDFYQFGFFLIGISVANAILDIIEYIYIKVKRKF